MKNVKLLLGLFAATAIFSSCGSDDDKGSATSGTLEGKWAYSKSGIAASGQEILTDYTDHEAGCTKDYIEFVAGGVFKDVDYYNAQCESSTATSTWVRTGNTLTTGTGEDASTLTITELNSNTLKFTYTDESLPGATLVEVFTKM